MDVFQVQTSPASLHLLGLSLVTAAIVSLLAGVSLLVLRKRRNSVRGNNILAAFIIGFALIITGVIMYSTTGSSSTITVGSGYISVSGQFIGNNTYTKNEIKTAFVDNINSGNLTLTSRNMGTSIGNINEGVYTLSNGASANVVSVNQTNLIIELDSGLYLVLGTSNTDALVTAFSANVIPVSGSR